MTAAPPATPAPEPWLEVSARATSPPGWPSSTSAWPSPPTRRANSPPGPQADGQLSVFERTFNRCMGLWGDGQTLWMSSLYQLWRFENVLRPGELHQGHDRALRPRIGYTTGDLDIHDIAVEAGGRVVFVATALQLPGHAERARTASRRCGGRRS